jgi:flagellar motor switch protein FliN/FliY
LASDISSIIQNELINTFDSLLSLESSITSVKKLIKEDIDDLNHIEIKSKISFNDTQSELIFYLPNSISTKFEYFMLGAMGDVKQSIDDETVDAVKEIISTVGGGLSTTINAQGFDDISKFSFALESASSTEPSIVDTSADIYTFNVRLSEDDEFPLFIKFDDKLLVFIDTITSGNKIEATEDNDSNVQNLQVDAKLDSLLSILGENSDENLKLLFDVKLKFSVRLGTKTFLLKDIVNWDVGQIIELEQMVNEPLDILINNIKVGVGEAVIVEGKFGIKVKYLGEED